MSHTGRVIAAVVATLLALLLQVAVVPEFVALGPSLVLLVVVGAALVTDPRFATIHGFAAGLLLDLAPPAEHTAGRWALALLIVGYVVGRLAHEQQPVLSGGLVADQPRRSPLAVAVAAAAGGSFVGTSVFALTGLLLGDLQLPVGDLLGAVFSTLAWDLVAGLLVVPATGWLFRRLAAPRPVARISVPSAGRRA